MPSTVNKRTWLALGIAVVVLGILTVWWMSRGEHRSTTAVVAPQEKRGESVALEPATEPARSSVEPAKPTTPSAPTFADVRVLDETFRFPVQAWISIDGAVGAFTDAAGRMRCTFAEGSARWLRVAAPGYAETGITGVATNDGGDREILLSGERKACVLVEYESGGSAPDLTVTWRAAIDEPAREYVTAWVDSRRQVSGKSVDTTTDAVGKACLAIASDALAVVEHPQHHARTTVRVSPGQTVRVVLSDKALHLRFVDAATDQPIAGLELDSWCPNEPWSLSQPYRTDADGVIALLPTSYPILVRRIREEIWLAELIPSSSAITRVGAGGEIHTQLRIERAPAEDPVTVTVKRCGGTLRLVDDVTNETISGRVMLRSRGTEECPPDGTKITACTLTSPGSRQGGVEGDVLVAKNGVLALPCNIPGPDSPTRAREKETSLVIVVEGYAPQTVPLADLPAVSATLAAEVRFTPIEQRRMRVVQPDGRPVRSGVTVYSPRGDVIVYSTPRASIDGLHGPFDWPGGELWIKFGDGNEWPFRFTAEQIARVQEILVTVPTDMGTIEVEGIPHGARPVDLIARFGISLGGIAYTPTRIAGGSCFFESLPVGTYVVGPKPWVLSAEMQSFTVGQNFTHEDHPSRLVVRANETTKMPWLDTWSARRRIEGRVRLVHGTAAPFLVPLYGGQGIYGENSTTGVPRMIFGRRSPRVPLDSDGTYHIDTSDPLPLVIAVCVSSTDALWGAVSQVHVIDTILPGESVDIPVGSVEFTWKGTPLGKPRWTMLEWPATAFRHPLETLLSRVGCNWDTRAPLRVDNVPLGAREMKAGKSMLSLELRAGAVTRVELDVDILAGKPR